MISRINLNLNKKNYPINPLKAVRNISPLFVDQTEHFITTKVLYLQDREHFHFAIKQKILVQLSRQ